MELRLNITALFLEFMGMSQNSKKSWMMGMEFDATGRHDIDETSWKPAIYLSSDLFGSGELPEIDSTKDRLCSATPLELVNTTPLIKGLKWLGF